MNTNAIPYEIHLALVLERIRYLCQKFEGLEWYDVLHEKNGEED
jgi:hypothetical protein